MKKTNYFLLALIALIFVSSTVFSQGVVVSANEAASPDPSAMLDVQSTEKGFLPPRMTTTERNNIVSPANGLVVYDTDEESLFLFNGTAWEPLVAGSGSRWEADGDDIYRNAGNVGIGTDTPSAIIHTRGIATGQGNVLFEGQVKFNTTLGLPPVEGSGTRMMWYPDKGAFRAGGVGGLHWNADSIGYYSVGLGFNTTALGDHSIALGSFTRAAGSTSFAWGLASQARGESSFAGGYLTISRGANSSTWGFGARALGFASTAWGFSSIAQGQGSTAWGTSTTASSFLETSMGRFNTLYEGDTAAWIANDRLFVVGNGTTSNQRSDALVLLKNGNLGLGTSFPQSTLHVEGSLRYEDGNQSEGKVLTSDAFGNATWADPEPGVETDPLYSASPAAGIGNSNISNWNDAFAWGDHSLVGYLLEENDPKIATAQQGSVPRWNGTELEDSDVFIQNGRLGIGTGNPAALLHTQGTGTGEGNVLFTGEFKFSNPGAAPVEGPGTRMMWYPDKAAFRAGSVFSTQWNTENVGEFSFAAGGDTRASANSSTAMGSGTTASGTASTAFGSTTTAAGTVSTAMGNFTNASGAASTAMGESTVAGGARSTTMGFLTSAQGESSTAMGSNTTARSFAETVIGSFNTIYTPSSATSFNVNDRLFIIGNGIDPSSRNDALVVMKSGNVGIGMSQPLEKLQVEGNIHVSGGNRTIFNRSNNSLAFGTNNQERMRILSDGRVGINTVTPAELLEVRNTGDVRIRVTSSDNVTAAIDLVRSGTGSTDWRIANDGNIKLFSGSNIDAGVTEEYSFGTGIFRPSVDNSKQLGSPSNRWISVHAVNGTIQTSDRRLKKNIDPLTYGLQQVNQLQPVTYLWKEGKDTAVHIGLIAQEVQKIIPEAVDSSDPERLGLNYSELMPVLIHAIQELSNKVDMLQEQNTQQSRQIQHLTGLASASISEN
jgi:hypothetical protein